MCIFLKNFSNNPFRRRCFLDSEKLKTFASSTKNHNKQKRILLKKSNSSRVSINHHHSTMEESTKAILPLSFPRIVLTCDLCERKGIMLKCTNCKVVFYCDKECQKRDWKNHKADCQEITANREKLKKQEGPFFRGEECWDPTSLTPEFGNCGQYEGNTIIWGSIGSQGYLRSMVILSNKLYKTNSKIAVKESLELCIKYLELSIMDDAKVCEKIPFRLLELDMDQEAFDFIIAKTMEKYLKSLSSSFSQYWGSDCSMDLSPIFPKLTFHNCIAMVFIRYRLIKLLEEKQRFCTFLTCSSSFMCNSSLRMLTGKTDVLRNIYEYAVGPNKVNNIHRTKDIGTLRREIFQMIQLTELRNNRIWKAICNFEPLMKLTASYFFQPGDADEAILTLKNCLRVSYQIDGLPEMLKEYCMKTHGNLNYDC
jgi:hypothetical protein